MDQSIWAANLLPWLLMLKALRLGRNLPCRNRNQPGNIRGESFMFMKNLQCKILPCYPSSRSIYLFTAFVRDWASRGKTWRRRWCEEQQRRGVGGSVGRTRTSGGGTVGGEAVMIILFKGSLFIFLPSPTLSCFTFNLCTFHILWEKNISFFVRFYIYFSKKRKTDFFPF